MKHKNTSIRNHMTCSPIGYHWMPSSELESDLFKCCEHVRPLICICHRCPQPTVTCSIPFICQTAFCRKQNSSWVFQQANSIRTNVITSVIDRIPFEKLLNPKENAYHIVSIGFGVDGLLSKSLSGTNAQYDHSRRLVTRRLSKCFAIQNEPFGLLLHTRVRMS